MKIEQFVRSIAQVGAALEGAPIAIGMMDMPEFRFLLANARYRAVVNARSQLGSSFLGKTVAEVLPNASPEAVQSLRDAHERGITARFTKISSVDLQQNVTYWTGASFPVLAEPGRTIVLGLLIESDKSAVKKIDGFLRAAIRDINDPDQGTKLIGLLAQAARGIWPEDDGAEERSA